ncbi:MAG: zinc-dependent metalloprotease [Pseudomonadota bacterium]
MLKRMLAVAGMLFLASCGSAENSSGGSGGAVDFDRLDGFVDLLWDESGGRLLISVEEFDTPFIYQSSMARGVGSNDLGLDRGQLGDTKLVSFERYGPKVLLVEHNLDYRALSDDARERAAIEQSFARSVIWGFTVDSENAGAVIVDGTAFFTRDSHHLGARLAAAGEGSYSVDASRSAIYLPRTKAFPDNTEVEAVVTYKGQATGPHLPTVTPDSTAVTVHLHHSFIRLPDDGYEPMAFDPRSGMIGMSYGSDGFSDYASEIGDPLTVSFGTRHRLEKVNPEAEVSEAVEPIVYYVDAGVPEPVRQALVDGAKWWNQAFEAAGYKDAFQVEILPDDADPMDVRYNVIQWVHRSTRGWSYGASVTDPRTGEIIKGHVSLGSLRVRQDYLIIEGLMAPYSGDDIPDTMLEVSLARIRQLSAHEVGHTIGFLHNFAASTQDRSSVMDYPVPKVMFDDNNELDFSEAYDDKIGSWDKRTVIYAYQDFPDGVDADAAREEILEETIALGYKYVTDADSRSIATMHPDGNLWDNGADAIEELEHLLAVREHALAKFGENNIRKGRPLATLEETLVPIYLLHRFQIQAVGKLIGGEYYHYNLRGDGQAMGEPVSAARQSQAIDALLATLSAEVLALPDSIDRLIPPRPPGHSKDRETFTGSTGTGFDQLAPAASATALTLDVLLNPQRAARMQRSDGPGFERVVDQLIELGWSSNQDDALQQQTAMIVLHRLMALAADMSASADVRAIALAAVNDLDAQLAAAQSFGNTPPHYDLARWQIAQMRANPASIEALPAVVVPPGSPIGSGE